MNSEELTMGNFIFNHSSNVYSDNGEDGVNAYLFNLMGILALGMGLGQAIQPLYGREMISLKACCLRWMRID